MSQKQPGRAGPEPHPNEGDLERTVEVVREALKAVSTREGAFVTEMIGLARRLARLREPSAGDREKTVRGAGMHPRVASRLFPSGSAATRPPAAPARKAEGGEA